MGVSPTVGGLRGSALCPGRPKGDKAFRGNRVARGENRPTVGVGGASTKRIPLNWAISWSGFFVIVSALGDMIVSSYGGEGAIGTMRSEDAPFLGRGSSDDTLLGKEGPGKLPKPAGGPKPGVGGGGRLGGGGARKGAENDS